MVGGALLYTCYRIPCSRLTKSSIRSVNPMPSSTMILFKFIVSDRQWHHGWITQLRRNRPRRSKSTSPWGIALRKHFSAHHLTKPDVIRSWQDCVSAQRTLLLPSLSPNRCLAAPKRLLVYAFIASAHKFPLIFVFIRTIPPEVSLSY